MKGTNPITQGHRWQKRVKERLKKHEHEEGQWERLEDKKSEEIRARHAAEESAAAAEAEIDPGAEAIFAAADAGTDLRDEEGLDAEELAAVRAVKAAKAAAQARLQRVQREGEKSNGAPDAPAKKRVKDSGLPPPPTRSRRSCARDPNHSKPPTPRRHPRRHPRHPHPNPHPPRPRRASTERGRRLTLPKNEPSESWASRAGARRNSRSSSRRSAPRGWPE